jgi:hypothetical protein
VLPGWSEDAEKRGDFNAKSMALITASRGSPAYKAGSMLTASYYEVPALSLDCLFPSGGG